MVDLKKLIDKFEDEFTKEKKAETEEIYNKMAEICVNGNINNILTAIELVKYSIILKKLREIYPDIFTKDGK